MSEEDRYFKEQEAHLREKLREELEANAKTAEARRHIAETVGVTDDEVAERIRELGFDGNTAHVLYLMPLVAVAWADGTLSGQERKTIVAAAEAHGIQPGSPGAILLSSLLEKRPSDELLDQILAILKDILQAKSLAPSDVVSACFDVAEASGSFMGFSDKISGEERSVLERITSGFSEDATDEIAGRLA
jgi:hypothetical protein